ncbi:membrane protein [Pandoraea pnomenusa]|uniref:Membrane protein n=1 Tax=Pandoraea pnomenusa TaxID=93220 RepID=A0ABY6WDH8_9BURK|nr:membrane protein [Pandoraea pnomenusa]
MNVPAAYFAWAPGARRAWLDTRIAPVLADVPLSTRDFAPLPVLGIPGWWPENEAPDFYRDTVVFRPGRRQKASA